jgi:hypothetical protein
LRLQQVQAAAVCLFLGLKPRALVLTCIRKAAIGALAIAAPFFVAAASGSGCRSSEPPPPEPQFVWSPLGAWSGRGNKQTESFTSDTGSLRVQWSTSNETRAGTGRFQLTIHSAISGRPLHVAVEQVGPGHDTAYVHEDPRVFFAVVDAAGLDWSFTIEEAVVGQPKDP